MPQSKTDLVPYKIYLNPTNPEDRPLVDYLNRYVPSRRTGEAIRRALECYLGIGANAAPMPPRHAADPYTPPPKQQHSAPPADSGTATSKIRGAFFKH